ncbi:MAG: hypothetical protein JWN70_684 [Planctomycetaceae bacterium]|nr:hypothetical protein [Planctomycetaceae bacterium]
MPVTTTPSDDKALADLVAYNWTPQPAAANLIQSLLEECLRDCSFAASLAQRMLDDTGTRLVDWLDHCGLPANHPTVSQLTSVGYDLVDLQGLAVWEHRAGMLPRVRVHSGTSRQLAIKVDSVVDFLVAHRLNGIEIIGPPFSSIRTARVADENNVEVWIVERHGSLAFDANPHEVVPFLELTRHWEAFRLRRRDCETDEAGFVQAGQLVDAAIVDLGKDRASELFFAAERESWLRCNRAGQVQKARQDALGLGWANHDHHTYRSSRHCFSQLIAFLERLGFVCRERFYAGREAGWGAQVIEHPVTGITIFADVDLSPEELSHDFSHDPLPPRNELGTVGLWCALHGESFLQAGMHHLECQFDFSATRDQLHRAGIETMPPFTDYPYLKQAFTKGEVWPVIPTRVERLRDAKLISAEQAQQFLMHGALGSHLEILQRNDGYKGFNQAGINQIIAATDPRRAAASAVSLTGD